MTLRLAIVDDNQQILSSLKKELSASGLVEVIFTAKNGSDYLDQLKHLSKEKRNVWLFIKAN